MKSRMKKPAQGIFYDLLVDKEILPAETLAQMQETFFRVERVAFLMTVEMFLYYKHDLVGFKVASLFCDVI